MLAKHNQAHVPHCKGQKTTDNMWAAKHHSKLPNTTLTGMAASASARHMQQKTFEKVIGVVPKGARATTVNRFHRQGTPRKRSLLPVRLTDIFPCTASCGAQARKLSI